MFEKLYLIVKNYAQSAIINNPLISGQNHEAIQIEASSTIIEVLKGDMESGKIDELIHFFQLPGFDYHALIKKIENKVRTEGITLRFAIVTYRDHPPQ